MKNRLFISEEEKNRILNLHKKQILKETTNHNPKLIREQEEKEIERLLALLDPNDPDPIKWQDIVNKIEAMGEDVITYIRKMKDKELAKKFGRWLKNNFNKVKFQQAADTVVSFFKNLGKKKQTQTPGPTPTPEPTPPPTPTPTEDPNAWKEDDVKQKEWLLTNGYTEKIIEDFEKNGYPTYSLFRSSYYEEPKSGEEITTLNVPKTMEQYYSLITKYGFKKFESDDLKELQNSSLLDIKDGDKLHGYLSAKKQGRDYTYEVKRTNEFNADVQAMDDVWFNKKTGVLLFTENNKIKEILATQLNFVNKKTKQNSNTKIVSLFYVPSVNLERLGIFRIELDNFNNYIINPTLPPMEEYEDVETLEKEFEKVRSWWFENGYYKFMNENGTIWRLENGKKTNAKYDDSKWAFVKDAVTKDINELENTIKKFLKDDDLSKTLQNLENLKNEARKLKLYE
jgi:hypothetical protein